MTDATLQFCWAHLIRELKFLAESKDKKVAAYGKRTLRYVRPMFRTIHMRDDLSHQSWKHRMNRHKKSILKTVCRAVPPNKDAKNISERLNKWESEYFRFIEELIPPTNNLGEQTIRKVVIDRKVTQNTRSNWGNRWLEWIWSVLATCEQRGTNVMSFLKSCAESFFHGLSPPSLLRD